MITMIANVNNKKNASENRTNNDHDRVAVDMNNCNNDDGSHQLTNLYNVTVLVVMITTRYQYFFTLLTTIVSPRCREGRLGNLHIMSNY